MTPRSGTSWSTLGGPACEIRKGLFLGSIMALEHVSDYGISHVLSVINDMPDLATRIQQLSMEHMLIDILDMEEANLLCHLERAVRFIKSALDQGGKVLVHCQAGMSRSASVVLAYLMAMEKTSVEAALASLKQTYRIACPNAGFLQQLQMWHEMQYAFKPNHPGYNTVMMRQLAMRYDAGEELASITNDLAVLSESAAQGMLYRCRKCRRLLATQSNVVPVTEGSGSTAFKYRKRAKGGGEQGEDRGSLWVTPMQWMQELSGGETQGKLYCPSCKARLGSFNWAGSQSESGAWVTPAFQLHHSKVDAMSSLTAAPLNIRRPLVGPRATPVGATNATAEDSDMHDGQQQTNSDKALAPLDMTRTVSDAAHAAVENAAQIEKAPHIDSKRALGNDCIH